jgi:outer membrane protein
MGGLKLRQANGTLKSEDLLGVNALLSPAPAAAPLSPATPATPQPR